MAAKNVKRNSKESKHELSLSLGESRTAPRTAPNTRRKASERRPTRRGVASVKQAVKRELNVHQAATIGGWMIDMPRIWRAIGSALLLPMCLITAMAFFSCFQASMEAAFWRSSPFWFFMLGMVMWMITFFGMGRPVYLYVWGHEATHALFTYLCLGHVHEFRVTREGGHIVTDKNNLLIALSPYFVPLYALMVAFLFWLAGAYFDLTVAHSIPIAIFPNISWQMLGYWSMGVAWGFHLTFTVWMIVKDQPDLKSNGTIFSLNVIVLANLLLLSLLLVQAAPTVSWQDFFHHWQASAQNILTGMAKAMLGLRKLLE
jgi:hypothetical protein